LENYWRVFRNVENDQNPDHKMAGDLTSLPHGCNQPQGAKEKERAKTVCQEPQNGVGKHKEGVRRKKKRY